MKKVCVITERRAEYGILKPVLRAITNKDMELCLIVTGSHLSGEFGGTVKNIEQDGFKINYKIPVSLRGDEGSDMGRNAGIVLTKVTDILKRERPDIVLVGFDIAAPLIAAIASNYMNIAVAHIHGGDVSGHVDDNIRHATTKLAHIHFPATKRSADRIRSMGEEEWRIHIVGAPGLDSIRNRDMTPVKEITKKYKLGRTKPIILVVQHPVLTEIRDAAKQMKITMEAVKKLGHQAVVIYPNSDAGGRRMIGVINQYKKCRFIQVHKSLLHEDYLGIMSIADVMVGNSSSGIIEAASFHLPVINIGKRQRGREQSGNVINVDYNQEDIIRSVKKALYNRDFIRRMKSCKNIYGDGRVGVRIADVLSKIRIDKKLLEKKWVVG